MYRCPTLKYLLPRGHTDSATSHKKVFTGIYAALAHAAQSSETSPLGLDTKNHADGGIVVALLGLQPKKQHTYCIYIHSHSHTHTHTSRLCVHDCKILPANIPIPFWNKNMGKAGIFSRLFERFKSCLALLPASPHLQLPRHMGQAVRRSLFGTRRHFLLLKPCVPCGTASGHSQLPLPCTSEASHIYDTIVPVLSI